MKFLLTGCAGFIGSFLTERLLREGDSVVGVDNLNSYYDPFLKEARLNRFKDQSKFSFSKIDIANTKALERVFSEQKFDGVLHLAAQVGVRYSLENPSAYLESNVSGFLNILENCRNFGVSRLIYSSSSSVYGNSSDLPLKTSQNTDHPISLYAATKKSNELMAYSYSHLFGIQAIGLRFFTVYGPWGRPDMAVFKFTRNILEGKPITVFNQGQHSRDMTYVDDVVESIFRLTRLQNGPPSDEGKYRIYNVGNGRPVQLIRLIEILEEKIGKKAIKNFVDASPGDVDHTLADSSELYRDTGFQPETIIETGIENFVKWYQLYYQV